MTWNLRRANWNTTQTTTASGISNGNSRSCSCSRRRCCCCRVRPSWGTEIVYTANATFCATVATPSKSLVEQEESHS